jgi:hypothetical protein
MLLTVVCERIQSWTGSAKVVGTRCNILMTASLCDIDVLCLRVEQWHWLEKCCCCVCSGLATLQGL